MKYPTSWSARPTASAKRCRPASPPRRASSRSRIARRCISVPEVEIASIGRDRGEAAEGPAGAGADHGRDPVVMAASVEDEEVAYVRPRDRRRVPREERLEGGAAAIDPREI